ncbi:hypothetical protein Tco_1060361 [Tanacetum coccineum]
MRQASNSFKLDERVTRIDIEGVPLCAWSLNTFVRILSKWGSLVYDEDKDSPFFHRKRLCIKTFLENNIFKSFKITVKGKIFCIRAKEVPRWVPTFIENNDSDDESVEAKSDGTQESANSEADSAVDVILDTVFEHSEEGEIRPDFLRRTIKPKTKLLNLMIRSKFMTFLAKNILLKVINLRVNLCSPGVLLRILAQKVYQNLNLTSLRKIIWTKKHQEGSSTPVQVLRRTQISHLV